MNFLLGLVLMVLLLVFAWPLALLVLVLWPVVWLLSIPFRILGSVLEAMLALVRALLFLPARMFGYRGA